MTWCIFILIFISAGCPALAQDRIDTDRPDQTESVTNVPKKYFQAEFGFGKENTAFQNYQIAHPSFLLKYGLLDRIELRVEGNYGSSYVQMIPNGKTTTALEPVEIGTRVMLLEEKGMRPKTSLLFHLGLPFLSSDRDPAQDVFPSFRLSMQHTLSAKASLGYNLGAEWDGYSREPVWLYTVSPNTNIGKRWYAYVEAFGFVKRKEPAQHNLDGGLAYYTSENTKVDLSAGIGLGSSNPLRSFIALGFSFRLATSKQPSAH